LDIGRLFRASLRLYPVHLKDNFDGGRDLLQGMDLQGKVIRERPLSHSTLQLA